MSLTNNAPTLPGQDLVEQRLADFAQNRVSEAARLVLIADPRLRRLGIAVPNRPLPGSWEHDLYACLEQRLGAAAHSYYNSLVRRIVSFARALEREQSRLVECSGQKEPLPGPHL
jgi:hypothetical protein